LPNNIKIRFLVQYSKTKKVCGLSVTTDKSQGIYKL